MNDTPDSGVSIASNSNGIDEFLDEFDFNEAETKQFRERRHFVFYFFIWFPVSITLFYLIDHNRHVVNDFITLSYIPEVFLALIIILFSLHGYVMFLTSSSSLTKEKLAYYELALSVQSYEDGDIDGVVEHLREAKHYLAIADLSDITVSSRQEILSYLSAIDNAANKEQAVQETFDSFIEFTVPLIMTPNEAELESLAKEIEQASSESFSPLRRVAEDITHGISSVFIGYWGIAILAVIAGLAANFLYSPTVGVGTVAVIFTAYVAYK